MHEVGIAQGIVDLVLQSVPSGRAAQVTSIRVRVGALSGVSADALAFCFDAVVAGSELSAARLEIERVSATCSCLACDGRFETPVVALACPACGSPRVRLEAGSDLQVVDLELDDPPSESA